MGAAGAVRQRPAGHRGWHPWHLALCLGAGSILAMPIAGLLTSRAGCRRVLIVSILAVCATLPLLAQLSPVVAGSGLVLFRRRHRRARLHHEHPGDHRRARQRTHDDVRAFTGSFSLGGVAGRRRQRPCSAWACRRGMPCWSWSDRAAAGLQRALVLPYGGRSNGPAFALATRRGAVHRRAVLHPVPDRGRGARLERGVPDRRPRHVGGDMRVSVMPRSRRP